MPVLSEITLENNPVEQQGNLVKNLRSRFPSLQYFNLQKMNNLLTCQALTAVALSGASMANKQSPADSSFSHKQRTLVSCQSNGKGAAVNLGP